MSHDIILPSLSAGMETGTLAKWLKAEGDHVGKNDVIAEIETDKATMELEAPAAGILGTISVQNGSADVPVGTILARLFADSASYAAFSSQEPATRIPVLAPVLTPIATPAPALSVRSTVENQGRILASPLARRIAQEQGINLETLEGSGPRKRIVRIDIERAIETRASEQALSPLTQMPSPVSGLGQTKKPDLSGISGERIPHTTMRKTIARRLSEAKATVPHFYLAAECIIDDLIALRHQINATGLTEKISINDFMVKALAAALVKVPQANVIWTDEAMILLPQVDISVAVATDGGLFTPIVRHADQKSIGTLSAEIRELAERARSGKLVPADYLGGSASISNLGMYGVSEFTAIINPPQSLIMAIGAATKKPVCHGDAIVGATCVTCMLSVDHRAIDGALAGQFLKAFKDSLENPLSLLI